MAKENKEGRVVKHKDGRTLSVGRPPKPALPNSGIITSIAPHVAACFAEGLAQYATRAARKPCERVCPSRYPHIKSRLGSPSAPSSPAPGYLLWQANVVLKRLDVTWKHLVPPGVSQHRKAETVGRLFAGGKYCISIGRGAPPPPGGSLPQDWETGTRIRYPRAGWCSQRGKGHHANERKTLGRLANVPDRPRPPKDGMTPTTSRWCAHSLPYPEGPRHCRRRDHSLFGKGEAPSSRVS